MGIVQYIGAQNPHSETVPSPGFQNFIVNAAPGEILTLPDAVCSWLVGVEPNWWVAAQGWSPPPANAQTGYIVTVFSNYTVLIPPNEWVLVDASSSGSQTTTLPDATIIAGQRVTIKNIGSSGTVTVQPQAGQTIDGNASEALAADGGSLELLSDGSVKWRVLNTISANQLPASMENVSRILAFPASSGGDDAAALNAIIAAAPVGSKIVAVGSYLLNSGPLVLYPGIEYDFSQASFAQSATPGLPMVTNKAQTPVATATDAATTGPVWDVWTTTAGTATGGSGTWSFSWNGITYTTPSIVYNASAATVLSALLAATAPDNSLVPGGGSAFATTGGPLNTTPIVITAGSYTTGPVSSLAIASNAYTGGTGPSFTHTTPGVAGNNTVTSATLAAVAIAGQTVRVVAAGGGPSGVHVGDLIGTVLTVVGSNITLGNVYGTAVNAGQTLTGATAYLYTRDTDIKIRGGRFTRTDATFATGRVDLHITRFRHIDRFEWTGANVNSSGVTILYGISFGDMTSFSLDKVRGSAGRDGVHIDGSCFDFSISDVKMTTGDDLVAITARNYDGFQDTAGDVMNGEIRDVHSLLGKGVAILAGIGTTVSGVKVDGVHGQCQSAGYPVRIADDGTTPAMLGGIFDEITVKNVDAQTGTLCVVQVSGTGIKRLMIDGVYMNTTNAGVNNGQIYFQGTAEYLELSGLRTTKMPTGSAVVRVANTGLYGIGTLVIRNSDATLNSGGCAFVTFGTTGAVARMLISNVSALGPGGSGNFIAASGATSGSLPSVDMANVRLQALSWMADTIMSTTFKMAAVEMRNMGSGIINLRAGSEACRLEGFFTSIGSSAGAVTVGAGAFLSINSPYWLGDQSKLTPTTGDRINNTVATGTVPTGELIYDGTRWRSLQTPRSVKSYSLTLAAGTVVQADTAVTVNSVITPSNIGAGGTVGSLSIVLNAGTGFTVNSTSNTDTSKVLAEVVQY